MTDGLPEYLVLDPKLDRLPRAELRALQSQRLRTMVSYCYERTPFWRRKFDTAGIRPQDIASIDDLPKIPFCTKAELQADQVADPPFGSYVGVSRRRWARSTTTGWACSRSMWVFRCRRAVESHSGTARPSARLQKVVPSLRRRSSVRREV